MKINWKAVLLGAKSFGQMFLPAAVSNAIDNIEAQVEVMKAGGKAGWSGPEKQQAALEATLQAVAAYEGLTEKDALNDEAVATAGRKLIDATVAQKHALAEFTEAVKAFKAMKNKPEPTDPSV